MKEHFRLVLAIGLGAVIGGVLNELLAYAGAPDWLVRNLPLGLDPPFTVDLVVLNLTFGLSLSMSFGSILGMLVALIACYRRP